MPYSEFFELEYTPLHIGGRAILDFGITMHPYYIYTFQY